MIEDGKQCVYRIGVGHNKWIIVMPTTYVHKLIPECLPEITKELKRKYGEHAITEFDHVEYLGRN